VNKSQIAEHRRRGSLRAQRALKATNVDFDAPIDVFGQIEREQVWLLFQPLDRLYGAYRRHDTPGIVIHAGHPHRLQRFTAAHELGHHLLGHDLSVDARDEVEQMSAGLPAQEVEAQAFAATYLMPVQLVNRGLAHLGLKRRPDSVTPEQAYRLSLDLGSSYTATITQLRSLDRITAANLRALASVQPIDIKTELALGRRPENARADVWPLSQADDGRTLWVRPDDELHVSLVESPTTGYRWRPQSAASELEIAGDEPVTRADANTSVYGAERLRHVWWRAAAPADAAIAAELRRGFETDGVAEHFEVAVHVQPSLTGDSDHGVSRRQLQLL
jgi:Zn-dependent peptidase ImmA (M78 family)/predicted secreted protein